MKIVTLKKLGTIGIANALVFAFVPPLFSPIMQESKIIYLMMLLFVVVAFYIDFVSIKGVFSHELKLRYFIFPFGGWLLVVVILLFTGIWEKYVAIVTNSYGSVIDGNVGAFLVYGSLLLISGLALFISTIVAYFISLFINKTS